jgi:hypothetical protein
MRTSRLRALGLLCVLFPAGDALADEQVEPRAATTAAPAAPGQEHQTARDTAALASLSTSSANITPLNAPVGENQTGASSQAISVPQGTGKVQGMGESFSAQLSTGIATFNVPIALPAARGAAKPSLALSYSSASGAGDVGVGWSFGVAFIARQTDRGVPRYVDPPMGGAWTPQQDRFVFGGGQELIPICLV